MTQPKAILVIGAGDATGGAIARRFAREGYIACVTRRNADKLEPLLTQIRADGGQAHGFASDARKEDEMVKLVETIERDIAPIDVAVFNIGDRYGLAAFRFNPNFPVNTLNLMRGAVAAQQLECFEPYVDTMFAAMWERGLKMDDPATIATTLSEAGLDTERLMQTSQTPAVKAELMASTQAAHDRGAFGSPTFFVGDAMYFGKDRLRDVEDLLGNQRRS